MAEEIDPALSCQVNAVLLASLKKTNAKVDKLQTTLAETLGLGGTQLQRQVQALAKAVSARNKLWRAAPEPLQPLGASEQEAVDVQDALQGGLVKVQATTEAVTRLLKQLGQAAAVLQAGAKTSHVWAVLQVASRHRWQNGQGHSPLIALPSEVLHTILHKAGKEARLVCFALRQAFSTPGAGIQLPLAYPAPPHYPRSRATAQVDACIARWPYPQGVTKLAADAPLEQSTCAAIGATFPSLQELSLPGWAEGARMALPPSITSLERRVDRPAWGSSFLPGVAGHFIALRSLSLTSCPEHHMLEVGLTALTALTQLSSLNITTCAREGWDESTYDWRHAPDARVGMGLEVWGTLAALPLLAHLCLDVPLEYHSDMPEAVAPLVALTHLTLRCSADMVKRDQSRGVPVPVLQVLQLLPVPLSSLHLLAHRVLTSNDDNHSLESRALVAQAICRLEVRNMMLDDADSYWYGSKELAPFLPPSLTSFATNSTLDLTPAAVSSLFPHPLPAISSLDINVDLCVESRGAMQLLGEKLPLLTSLTLFYNQPLGRPISARGNQQRQAIPDRPPLVAWDLSQLSKLQQLSISGRSLEELLTPALSTLPALTSLGMQSLGAVNPLQLSRLRSLHLNSWVIRPLEAVRQMDGLTELVLDAQLVLDGLPDAIARLLVQPPVGLQRLVLPEEMVAEAWVALEGHTVDVVGLSARGGQSSQLRGR